MQPKPFKVSHAIRPRLNHPIPEFMAAEVYRRQWTTDDEARLLKRNIFAFLDRKSNFAIKLIDCFRLNHTIHLKVRALKTTKSKWSNSYRIELENITQKAIILNH